MAEHMKLLGAVTIGQSPRDDVIPEMMPYLGPNVKIIQAGALDGLSLEQVRAFYPDENDYVLITKMADGKEVKIAEKHILPRMQEKIDNLIEQGAQAVVLICTGEFPGFKSKRLLVEPQKVLYGAVGSVATGLRLGVFIPDVDQVPQAQLRWSKVSKDPVVLSASPYGDPGQIVKAAEQFKAAKVQMAVLDCIGYTNGAKDAAKKILGVPVVLARSVVARVLGELL